MTFVIILAGMVLLAYWAYLDHQQKLSERGALPPAEFEALKERLAAMETEQARLRQRVENLEAIVTSEAYELEREARQALPRPGRELTEGGGKPPFALEVPEEHEAEDDEARATRLARRVRGG